MSRTGRAGLIAIGILSGVLSAGALEVSDDLRLRVQKDIQLVEQEGPRMGDLMAGIREAGASYLPELPAPIDPDRYQALERQRMIIGVYLMDLTYAATFYQQQPAARYGQAIARLLEKVGFPQPDMERHIDVAPPPKPAPANEFELDEPEADTDAARQASVRRQMRGLARQASLDPGDGIEL